MKQRILACMLCLCLLTLCACGQTQSETQTDIPVAVTPSPVLQTAVATDELMAEFNILYSYGSDPYEANLFWCECDISDVYIISVSTDSQSWTSDGVHLYDLELLRAGEAIYYTATVPEGAPCEAIAYSVGTDTYMYAISYNGRDGGISLIAIDTLVIGQLPGEPESEAESDQPSDSEQTSTSETSQPTAADTSTEIMIELFWVSTDSNAVYAKELTIESDSKWHVWKALKTENAGLIPMDCSLLSAQNVMGRNGLMELDFSASFNSLRDSQYELLILKAIANTYIEAYNLTAVRFMVEGNYYESPNCEYSAEFGFSDF